MPNWNIERKWIVVDSCPYFIYIQLYASFNQESSHATEPGHQADRYVKANSGKVLEQVKTAGPMVITQNGEAAAGLMGVRDYEELQESMALLKILALGKKEIEEGKASPAAEAFARLRARRSEVNANVQI